MSTPDHDSSDRPDRPRASQLERLRRGDEDAWEEVVRAHGARLLAVARRIVRDEQLARDCLQNALVQAYLKIGTFEERAALTSWLHRIVVNSALMAVRSRKRLGEESLDDLLPAFDQYGQRLSESGLHAPTPEELFARADAREVVERAIDALPDGHRMVLLLRDFEELSIQEVAELMQLTPNAVKIRLHRARAALKTLLERPPRRAGAPARARLAARIAGIAGRYLPLMITCREFDSFITNYLEGSLTTRERFLFEIHVRTCRECRRYLKGYQQTLALGHSVCHEVDESLPPEVPPRLVAAIARARSAQG